MIPTYLPPTSLHVGGRFFAPLAYIGIKNGGGRMQETWESKLWRAGPIPLLEARVRIPLGFHPKIDGYYLARKESLFSLCEGDLPALQTAYEDDPDPFKRFRHRRAVFTLSCEACAWGDCLAVWECYSHSGGGGQHTVTEMRLFSLSSGGCLPRACAVNRRVFLAWKAEGLLPKSLSRRRFLAADWVLCEKGPALRMGDQTYPLPPPKIYGRSAPSPE